MKRATTTLRRHRESARKLAAGAKANDRAGHVRDTRVALSRGLFEGAEDIGGDGGLLLRRFGIERPFPSALRFAARLRRGGGRSEQSAIVAPITPLHRPHDLRALAVLWCADASEEVWAPPAADGHTRGYGVCLGDVGPAVVVAESIVTAAVAGRMVALPAVATICAQRLAVLELPPQVRRVLIAHDSDPSDASADAALTLARRAAAFGVSVALLGPPIGFDSWRGYGRADGEARHG